MNQNLKSFLLGGACVLAGGVATFAIASRTGLPAHAADTPDGTVPTPTATRLTPGRVISQDDFTRAAEETVNGVVSVKSYVYATPRSQRRQQQFIDPFFEFFSAPSSASRLNRRSRRLVSPVSSVWVRV